jgi:hypothetical protein
VATSLFSLKIMNRVVTPTQIIFTTVAGPMQVNVTFMNPVEVCFLSSDSVDSTSTYALQARKLGQAIDTILLLFSHSNIAGQFGP